MLDEVQLGYISQNTAQHQMNGLHQLKMRANTNTRDSDKIVFLFGYFILRYLRDINYQFVQHILTKNTIMRLHLSQWP